MDAVMCPALTVAEEVSEWYELWKLHDYNNLNIREASHIMWDCEWEHTLRFAHCAVCDLPGQLAPMILTEMHVFSINLMFVEKVQSSGIFTILLKFNRIVSETYYAVEVTLTF